MKMNNRQRTLTFYGSSDDNFVCEDSSRRDDEEIGCYNEIRSFKVVSDNQGLQVIGVYGLNGIWSIGISQIDEEFLFPNWTMRMVADGYTVRLVIDVPDSTICNPNDEPFI